MQILFLVALVPCFIYYLLKGTKTLHMLQQNWYNEGNRYIRWILENKYKVFIESLQEYLEVVNHNRQELAPQTAQAAAISNTFQDDENVSADSDDDLLDDIGEN